MTRAGGRFVFSILHPCFPGGQDVSGAWPPHWPELTTGSTGLPSGSGARQEAMERTTESSDSQNLFAMPLTWNWSTPARRQSFW